MYKFVLIAFLGFLSAQNLCAQSGSYDSIAFHLYTDSLKPYIANYISIDGRRKADKRWFPLSASEVIITCTAGKMDGNDFYLDTLSVADSVVFTARLIGDPKMVQHTVAYRKKDLTEKPLKTEQEILDAIKNQPAPSRRKKKN